MFTSAAAAAAARYRATLLSASRVHQELPRAEPRSVHLPQPSSAHHALAIRSHHSVPHVDVSRVPHDVISYAQSRVNQDFIREVRRNQLAAGYQVDSWGAATMRQLRTRMILQSLVDGVKSLWLPDGPVTVPKLIDWEDMARAKKTPVGTSQYFAESAALEQAHGQIHDGSPDQERHYHAFVQVFKSYCPTTGTVRRGFRETLGIFNRIPEWVLDVPLAVSEAQANSTFNLQLKSGQVIQINGGKGGVLQVVVPYCLLPIIHASCSRIIQHKKEGGYGVFRPSIDHAAGTVKWEFKSTTSLHEGVMIADASGQLTQATGALIAVDPAGEASIRFKI